MKVNYQVPVSLYIGNYTMATHDDFKAHIAENFDFNSVKEFKVEYVRKYMYFVNWDTTETKLVKVKAYETYNFTKGKNGARLLEISLIVALLFL